LFEGVLNGMADTPNPEDRIPQEPVAEEPDLHPTDAEPPAVETRGIRWLIVPALLGLVLGALIGLVQATGPGPKGETRELLLASAVQGAVVGLIAGGVFGLLVWVLFPYKGHNPHAPRTEEGAKNTATPERAEERGE
jgi:hypothetical protein